MIRITVRMGMVMMMMKWGRIWHKINMVMEITFMTIVTCKMSCRWTAASSNDRANQTQVVSEILYLKHQMFEFLVCEERWLVSSFISRTDRTWKQPQVTTITCFSMTSRLSYEPIHLPIHLPTQTLISLIAHPSIHPSINPPIHQPTQPSNNPSIYKFTHLSTYQPIQPWSTQSIYSSMLTNNLPLRVFMCEIAILKMVSLSGLRASVLHVGTMSHNSFI